MIIVKINKEVFSVLKRPFQKRYIFYTSVAFFVLLAFVFLSTSQIKYKVSAVIGLNNANQSAELVAGELKSKTLVQNAVNQLPLEVNYYKESSPKEEIYGDSLPVRLVVDKTSENVYAKNLVIQSLSSHSFSIDHEDTIQFYEINEPIKRYYGKFRVVRGPAFTPHFETFIVKLNEPFELFENYYKNLTVSPDEGDKTVALSVTTTNAQKGQEFLYKLLQLYSASHSKALQDQKKNYSDSINILSRKLELLQAGNNKKSPISTRSKLGIQQSNTLKVIEPYLQKPVNQFVQVPYTEEVQNHDLRDDLDGYNKMQLEKQRLLAQSKPDDLEVANIDKRISILKASVLSSIDRLQHNEEPNTQPDKNEEKRLQADILKYQRVQNEAVINTSNIKIVEKPEDKIKKIAPNAFLVYAMAVLIGLLIPMLFTWINSLKNASITQRQWFSSQTFSEKIKILVGSRQID